jgi:hypothetical protein
MGHLEVCCLRRWDYCRPGRSLVLLGPTLASVPAVLLPLQPHLVLRKGLVPPSTAHSRHRSDDGRVDR